MVCLSLDNSKCNCSMVFLFKNVKLEWYVWVLKTVNATTTTIFIIIHYHSIHYFAPIKLELESISLFWSVETSQITKMWSFCAPSNSYLFLINSSEILQKKNSKFCWIEEEIEKCKGSGVLPLRGKEPWMKIRITFKKLLVLFLMCSTEIKTLRYHSILSAWMHVFSLIIR